jgi:hypothetical protein
MCNGTPTPTPELLTASGIASVANKKGSYEDVAAATDLVANSLDNSDDIADFNVNKMGSVSAS